MIFEEHKIRLEKWLRVSALEARRRALELERLRGDGDFIWVEQIFGGLPYVERVFGLFCPLFQIKSIH